MSSPAKFPRASAPLEILVLDFVGRERRNFLRPRDAFARSRFIKYFGRGDDKEAILPAKRV